MGDQFSFDDLDVFTAGTVGPPGQRAFYLQARHGTESVTLRCEKQQVAALGRYLADLLSDLPDPDDASVNVQQRFAESVERAFITALRGGEPQWNALVRSFGLTPLDSKQRVAIRRVGVPKLKGVLPIELRNVHEEIRVRIAKEPGAEALSSELETFVERELLRYVAAAQPFPEGNRPVVRVGSAAEPKNALNCGCCDAPRPTGIDGMVCAFCGAKRG